MQARNGKINPNNLELQWEPPEEHLLVGDLVVEVMGEESPNQHLLSMMIVLLAPIVEENSMTLPLKGTYLIARKSKKTCKWELAQQEEDDIIKIKRG